MSSDSSLWISLMFSSTSIILSTVEALLICQSQKSSNTRSFKVFWAIGESILWVERTFSTNIKTFSSKLSPTDLMNSFSVELKFLSKLSFKSFQMNLTTSINSKLTISISLSFQSGLIFLSPYFVQVFSLSYANKLSSNIVLSLITMRFQATLSAIYFDENWMKSSSVTNFMSYSKALSVCFYDCSLSKGEICKYCLESICITRFETLGSQWKISFLITHFASDLTFDSNFKRIASKTSRACKER